MSVIHTESSWFLERDLPAHGVNIASDTMRRFWLMLAHYHAQLLVDARALPCAALERLGVGSIVRSGGYDRLQLPRQTDRCARRQTTEALARESEQASGEGTQDIHPRFGVVACTAQSRDTARFGGSSLRLGFEVKRTVAPALTPSMRSALQDLKLKSLTVVHAGNETFPLSKQVQAVAIDDLLKIVKSLR
jgi:hypothetical protein